MHLPCRLPDPLARLTLPYRLWQRQQALQPPRPLRLSLLHRRRRP